MKIRSNRSRGGFTDLLLNFAPLIYPERLKLETSNFVCIERAKSPNRKYANYVKRCQGAASRILPVDGLSQKVAP